LASDLAPFGQSSSPSPLIIFTSQNKKKNKKTKQKQKQKNSQQKGLPNIPVNNKSLFIFYLFFHFFNVPNDYPKSQMCCSFVIININNIVSNR
jgi:hypothetical protein